MIWFVLAISIYNIMLALIMKTKNLSSSLVFKVFPFLLGMGSMLYFLIETGVVR